MYAHEDGQESTNIREYIRLKPGEVNVSLCLSHPSPSLVFSLHQSGLIIGQVPTPPLPAARFPGPSQFALPPPAPLLLLRQSLPSTSSPARPSSLAKLSRNEALWVSQLSSSRSVLPHLISGSFGHFGHFILLSFMGIPG